MQEYEDILESHYRRRLALGVERRGNVVGPRFALDKLPARAFKVADWRDGRAPSTKEDTLNAITNAGLRYEIQYDAAHGFRYRLMVYAPQDRAAVVSFGTVNAENQ